MVGVGLRSVKVAEAWRLLKVMRGRARVKATKMKSITSGEGEAEVDGLMDPLGLREGEADDEGDTEGDSLLLGLAEVEGEIEGD